MNKKLIIALAAVTALLGVVILTLYLLSQQQDVRSRADQPVDEQVSQQQSCPTPAQVQNVQVEFPNCTGDVCNFTEAACSWNAVAGATKYKLTVTQVESAAVVKNEEVDAALNRVVFPITQNKTYKCDVSAINSCGAVGVAGSHSLFCEVDALLDPTPAPTAPPAKSACGFSCASSENCETGQICAIGASGQGYCAFPSFENTCKLSPSVSSCCSSPTLAEKPTAPPPAPTIVPPGNVGNTLALGTGIVILFILGLALFTL